MSYQITLQPGAIQYAAEADETLLEAALRQGVKLPYGCKNGACCACKTRLIDGTADRGAYQPHALTAHDIEEGKLLPCTAYARSDLTLENHLATREIPVKLLPARVETMRRAAHDVMILSLRLPASERFPFRAGQYIDILLPEGQRRSYSIANAPEREDMLELHIRRVPGGRFTGQVFEQMKVKDILRFEGPHGGFFLREESDKPVILIASGTGFAPIKAIVEHTLAQNIVRPMRIYWGCRARADLYLPDLPAAWAAEYPHIRFVPVLSAADADWRGRTGFVHQAVMADYPDLSQHEVYACGNPAMIDGARRELAARCRLPETAFFADAFTFNA
ncbi:MAG: CDP-6-deoxy-delta-3,4-glucoseen reductase [Zoogloeaceae bacterium]|jgi:CDP-4-dehydro-6-deoxyglucose reductase|nr:CDP-6-deoxy-delta-3,4-glucoseen reductase [Zoogloeaceae bacterium]